MSRDLGWIAICIAIAIAGVGLTGYMTDKAYHDGVEVGRVEGERETISIGLGASVVCIDQAKSEPKAAACLVAFINVWNTMMLMDAHHKADPCTEALSINSNPWCDPDMISMMLERKSVYTP